MPLKYLNRNNNSSVISVGNSVLFNGSNQYLSIPGNAAFAFETGNFTIEWWQYMTSQPSNPRVFSIGSYPSTTIGVSIEGGTFYLWENSGIGFNYSLTAGGYLNRWLHFAISRNNGTTSIFKDGIQIGSSYSDTNNINNTSTALSIGQESSPSSNSYFPGYISNFRIVKGTALYTSNFTPPTSPLTAIANTSLLTCQSATIIDNSSNNFTITNNGAATVSSTAPFTTINIPSGVRFLNRSNIPILLPGTQKAIFGYGRANDINLSITNLVSNTGVVATDTTGVGTGRNSLAAAGYGGDKAIFGYGYNGSNLSMTNLVSNTGVVSTDTTGVGTARDQLAAAGYGSDKALFGYGFQSGVGAVSMTNKVSNTGVVSTDTTGIGTGRYYLAAAGYGSDKAIFGYGVGSQYSSMTNLVSNTGVVATDTTGVGTVRAYLAAAGYGSDKAIFGYGYSQFVNVTSITNLVSNTGVVATDTAGVGTARYLLAAAGYGSDKAIFGYGSGGGVQSITNLVSNTGVVSTDTTGVGTARTYLAAAGFSVSYAPTTSNFKVKKIYADPPNFVTNGLVLYLDASNASSYPGSGTTWTDLSGNGNNGTLINGPTFNSENGGSIVFDGSNDYIQFSTVSAQTVCFWGRMDTGISQNAALVATSAGGDGSLRTNPVGTFTNSGDSNDFHNGYVSSLMINGVSNLSSNGSGLTIPGGRTLFQDFYVGTIGNAKNISTISHTFMGRTYKGRVYAVYLYNRQLTNAELLQNYNELKSRFGL